MSVAFTITVRSTSIVVVMTLALAAIVIAAMAGRHTIVAGNWGSVACITNEGFFRFDGAATSMMTTGIIGGISYAKGSRFGSGAESNCSDDESND